MSKYLLSLKGKLPAKTMNVLYALKIDSFEKLCRVKDKTFMKVWGCGPQRLKEIKDYIESQKIAPIPMPELPAALFGQDLDVLKQKTMGIIGMGQSLNYDDGYRDGHADGHADGKNQTKWELFLRLIGWK